VVLGGVGDELHATKITPIIRRIAALPVKRVALIDEPPFSSRPAR